MRTLLTAAVAAVVFSIYSSRLGAEIQVLKPVEQIRLSDIVPNGIYSGDLQVQSATSSKAGVFLLCTAKNPSAVGTIHLMVSLSEQGKYRSVMTVAPSLPTIAADDAGNVALLGLLPDKRRLAYVLAPDGNERKIFTHPKISRIALLNGHFYGLWDQGVLLLPGREATASEILFNSQQPLFNETVVPLSGERFALIKRSDASMAVLDVNTGMISPFLAIESPEIKFRSQPRSTPEEPGPVVSNALKSVASNGDGSVLISPTGHHFSESVVLTISDQAAVSRTLRFSMPKWDDLRSSTNAEGHLQGQMLLKTSTSFIWINQAHARLALYNQL
ncbi:MAG: hypothetical protein HYX27_26230 [Acidobacteria bacterium]|nr:hypothetical protein [Acidobacteriota bacterium]